MHDGDTGFKAFLNNESNYGVDIYAYDGRYTMGFLLSVL